MWGLRKRVARGACRHGRAAAVILVLAVSWGLPGTATGTSTVQGYRQIAAVPARAQPILRLGARGQSVAALQRRLATLHYDLGPVDGVFGPQTLHAVVAFQKVNGLARTGVVNATVWAKLAHPVLARLRYVRSGSGLEVDLTRQVLLRASGGALATIYDVSTGRPSLPTPVSGGRPFHIWRRALWGSTGYGDSEEYVQYYYAGSLLAIHAYAYVPPFPDSHGCIRLVPASAARLWSLTSLGEPVYTYR